MTRLLFIPDENTLLLLDSPINPEALILSIQNNLWVPPDPWSKTHPSTLQAHRVGSAVVVFQHQHPKKACRVRQRKTSGLTRRQGQVLRSLADGLTTSQIAARLKLSPRTVTMHIEVLKKRLGAINRAEAVSKGLTLGLDEARYTGDDIS